MEVNNAVNCPHCGKVTTGGKTCDSCGRDLTPSQGVEVQYKDFKVSELLDIKVGQQFPEDKGGIRKGSGHETDGAVKRDPLSGKQLAWKKRFGLVKTIVIVMLAAIALFFLLKSGMKF